MTTILALWGYAGSGKDEVAKFLVKHHGFERVAVADQIKAMALEINPVIGVNGFGRVQHLAGLVHEFGWDAAKQVPEVRQLLQNLGVAARRHLHHDIWVDVAMRQVDNLTRSVITDCRFMNEVEAVRDRGGFVVRVVRPGIGPANGHVSESALKDYQGFAATIHNDGHLDELGEKVERVMERLGIL